MRWLSSMSDAAAPAMRSRLCGLRSIVGILLVLLLIVGESTPQALLGEAFSVINAYLVIATLMFTELGLSLLEAMHLGVPVVALAATEAHDAVPPGTGVVTNRWSDVEDAARWLLDDVEAGAAMGKRGRAQALERYGLERFLRDWDRLLEEVAA